MDRRRTITLSVKDDFSKQLREYARGMDSANQATEQLGSRGSRSVLDMAQNLFYLGNSAKIVYGTFQQVLGTAQEWARMGAQTERSAYALRVYAGSAEEAERWTVAIQTAMRGTVTEGEAAAQAYMLMKFGLADSAEAAGEFARMLSVVAAANPQLGGTENALSQIQLTLANASFMRLDQLGLSVDQVKRRMEELQRAMPGLSREAAFQEAVIEGLKEQADKLGDGMANITLKQDQLNARSREFKERFGKTVNEALETGAGAALDLYDALVLLTSEPWTVVVNIAQVTLDELTLPKVVEDSRNQFMTQPGLRGWAVDFPARGGPFQRMTPEDIHYYYMRVVTRQAEMERQRYIELHTPIPYSFPDINPYTVTGAINKIGAVGYYRQQRQLEAEQAEELRRYQIYRTGARWQQWGPINAAYMRMYRGEQIGGAMREWRGIDEASYAEGIQTLREGAMQRFREADFATSWRDILPGMMEMSRQAELYSEQLREIAREAEHSRKTLEELWGLDPTAFGASVYQHGTQALRDYGVESEKAEEATRYLAIMTGEANAASEIFRLRAEAAAEALEKGQLSTAGYAIQIGLLSREAEGWSWVDKLTPEITTEEDLRAYVELIERLAAGDLMPPEILTYLDTWKIEPGSVADMERLVGMMERVRDDPRWTRPISAKYPQVTLMALIPQMYERGGMERGDLAREDLRRFREVEEASITGEIETLARAQEGWQNLFQPIFDDLDGLEAESELTWGTMGGHVTYWVDTATGQIHGFRTRAFEREMTEMERRMKAAFSGTYQLTLISKYDLYGAHPGAGGGRTLGGRAIPEFQRGGYTGDGPPGQIAGVVHRGEYVLSQDMLRKMRQGQRAPDFPRMGPMIGGGGGGVTITGPIHVHGVQNAAQLLGELKREAARKNTRLVEAMS